VGQLGGYCANSIVRHPLLHRGTLKHDKHHGTGWHEGVYYTMRHGLWRTQYWGDK